MGRSKERVRKKGEGVSLQSVAKSWGRNFLFSREKWLIDLSQETIFLAKKPVGSD